MSQARKIRHCRVCAIELPMYRYTATCGDLACLRALKSKNAKGRKGKGGRKLDFDLKRREIMALRGWPSHPFITNDEVSRWRDRRDVELFEAYATQRHRGWP